MHRSAIALLLAASAMVFFSRGTSAHPAAHTIASTIKVFVMDALLSVTRQYIAFNGAQTEIITR